MKKRTNKYIKVFSLLYTFIIIVIIANVIYLNVFGIHAISGINMRKQASYKEVSTMNIQASRGKIYDRNGELLAYDVTAYKLIAFLSEKRGKGHYVPSDEIPLTAVNISESIGIPVEDCEAILRKDAYQVEFGGYGSKLSLAQKRAIEEKGIAGLGFEEVTVRYYRHGAFASYLLGFTSTEIENNKSKIVGKMGIESRFDEWLTGDDGKMTCVSDSRGYCLVDSVISKEDARNGSDIYLTIDANLQNELELALENIHTTNGAEKTWGLIMDAKTGEIMAMSNRPTFDPNLRNIENYIDTNIGYAYEPGSTIKAFTYAAAMDMGVYNGADTFLSGKYEIFDKYGELAATITDFNNVGWGTINYDVGFIKSSNVGVANLVRKSIGLGTKKLSNYFERFGLGSRTGVELFNESKGNLYNVTSSTDEISAGFGQSMSATAIQIAQAYTAFVNKGKIVNPSVVKQVVDPNKNEVIFESTPEYRTVISEQTAESMKNLLHRVFYDEESIGKQFAFEEVPIFGKSGTAQISERGKYLTGTYDHIYSYAVAAPYDNPRFIIYIATEKTNQTPGPNMALNFKSLVNVLANYYQKRDIAENIKVVDVDENKTITAKEAFELPSFINKSSSFAYEQLNGYNLDYYIIGDGKTIIKQYPQAYTKITSATKVFLLTDGLNFQYPDMIGWSKKDVMQFLSLTGVKSEFIGSGYVVSQSIAPGLSVNLNDDVIRLELVGGIVEEVEEEIEEEQEEG